MPLPLQSTGYSYTEDVVKTLVIDLYKMSGDSIYDFLVDLSGSRWNLAGKVH